MQILSTKLSIPPLRSRPVTRLRLIQKLNQGLDSGLILISAPAGYGKSTLLSDWLSQLKYDSAWFSLDDRDNDPARFLCYLVAALRQIDSSFGAVLENSLKSFSHSENETLLTPLINQMVQVDQPFCLVLDDYHVIQNQTVHQIISFLLDHRPPGLHLVIATRADPPLHLAKLRARSELLELRQLDLRFTLQEAADFLNMTMGLHIIAEDIVRITDRTEGWIAGLQMAAISLQNTEDVSGFIAELSGNHHYIFDYLLEEILGRQSTEIQRFLLFTSILDQLTAPLCEALLASDSNNDLVHSSLDIFEELERENLFFLPLDHERHWYRYHHLFSDLLKLMLEKTYPGLAIELHCRASTWYEAQGMLSEALDHALSAGDLRLVAQIISANVLVLVENDEVIQIIKRIDALPMDKVTAQPWLGIARAWILETGQNRKSEQILDDIEKNLQNAQVGLEQQRLRGHIAAVRAHMLGVKGNSAEAIENAKTAIDLLPVDEIAVRARCLTIWGDVLVGARNVSSAIPILEQALKLALQARKPHVAMIASASLATGYLFMGRMYELERTCQDALLIAENYQKHYQHLLLATADVYPMLARVLAEWGDTEKAIQIARKGVMLSERWGQVVTESLCLCYLGRALIFGNYWEQAWVVLQRANNIAWKISPWVWQEHAIFILDSLLDSKLEFINEITQQVRRIEERGACIPNLLAARLKLRDNQPNEALAALEKAHSELNGQPSFDTVRIYILQALAYQALGNEKNALAILQQALNLGEPENRVASFVQEGAEMERLLQVGYAQGIVSEFVHRLLAAFEIRSKSQIEPTQVRNTLVEPLSEREMDIIKHLAQGFSDKKIAECLVIARETVHKHLKNIYGKLDVHSRTEALARVRELGLI
ncbi:MAG: LuxR C-terminal-related transcriptional regulator [Chloroflexota bacterium]